ncbi:MAG: nucleoside triphosphate pyrophosphohydrolase [archaeon]|nr:nucleoside triphosphate pyrophosphohydrolase [archaeon]
MKYDKLVRDKIIEILKLEKLEYSYHIASKTEYEKKLKEKLIEEVNEFLKDGALDELADIQEVVNAICNFYGFYQEDLEKLRRDKFESRGGLEKRIILDEVKEK